ncbi:MAG: YIP1 family protein [Candidatus Aenigmatarchaeota archaeon]
MVYFQTLKEILINPVSALAKAKRERNLNKTLIVLLVDWVIFALAALVVSRLLSTLATRGASFLLAPIVFFLGFLGSLFFALLTQILFDILGGKGKYFEALTPLAYSKFALSLGVFLASLFSMLPFIGLLLSLVVLSLFGAMGISIFYRGIKEMFGIDMITTWVGIGLLVLVLVFSFYASVMLFGISSGFLSQRLMGLLY